MDDFVTSPLAHSLYEISHQEGPKPFWRWSFEFKVLPESGFDFEDKDLVRLSHEKEGFFRPIAATNMDFIADYEKSFCDHVNCNVTVGAGMWMKVLAPYREHLRVYLTRTKLLAQGGEEDTEAEPLVLIFKPIFKDNQEAHETISETNKLTRLELDMRMILNLDVDLLDPSTEAVQTASCGGIWRRTTAADVMQAVFANVCAQMTYEGEPLIVGQVIADKTNKEKTEHINVESGTPLVDLPMMLQTSTTGIWPTGCSRYLHGKVWYFYPPYDTSRVEREQKTLTIIKVPETASLSSKHSFFIDGDHLKIIAGSDTQIENMTQRSILGQGDGVRYAASGSVMDDWLETKDNKAYAKRGKTNTETRMKADDQTDHRTFNSDIRFTDNTMQQMSQLASRKGQLLSFSWMYADHTLIIPGMACRVLYDKDGEVKELQGVVVGRHAAIQTTQQAASLNGGHLTTCALFVFCNEAPEAES